MKPLVYTLLCALLLLGRSAAAQNFPNNGLDTWASPYGVEAPTNWQTTDGVLDAYSGAPKGSYQTGTVTKTTDVHGGAYAAKLATLALRTNSGGTVNVPGYLVLGTRVYTDANGGIYGGLPYTARPTQMQFYYKLSGASAVADKPGIQVVFSRTVGNTSQVIGEADLTFAATQATYTLGTLNPVYISSALPDSVTIYAVSGNAQTVTAGTVLQIDDITFTGGALPVRADASLQQLVTVSPNPSPSGRFAVSSPAQPELAAAALTVFDTMGREVLRQPAQVAPTPTRELDLSGLALGIYTLRLDSKQGVFLRQLVVK